MQILTGHGNLGAHLARIGKQASNTCGGCELYPETRDHLVEECPAYHRTRGLILDGITTDLKNIVESLEFARLADFLVSTGRLEKFNN